MKKLITFLTIVLLIINLNYYAQWSIANLSSTRSSLAAASVGSKAIFAGGIGFTTILPAVCDFYQDTSNSWTAGSISKGRTVLAAAVAGNKILFAGGVDATNVVSNVVDIYDVV